MVFWKTKYQTQTFFFHREWCRKLLLCGTYSSGVCFCFVKSKSCWTEETQMQTRDNNFLYVSLLHNKIGIKKNCYCNIYISLASQNPSFACLYCSVFNFHGVHEQNKRPWKYPTPTKKLFSFFMIYAAEKCLNKTRFFILNIQDFVYFLVAST